MHSDVPLSKLSKINTLILLAILCYCIALLVFEA